MWDTTSLGFALVFLGFAVVVVALLTKSGKSNVKGAGVVMIGPIPLMLGSDAKWASVAIALALVLVLLSILFYVL